MNNHNFDPTHIKQVDYKDIEMLKRFLTTHARIHSKKKTRVSSRMQRKISQAIKHARYMGLLPYISK